MAKIREVTPEVTLFLRSIGLSNYYIVKIFDLVGESAIGLTEDNPYWLLEEFPRMGFAKVDAVAKSLGFGDENRYRVEAGIAILMKKYASEGHSFAFYKDLCRETAENLQINSELVEDVTEDMVFDGRLQLADVNGVRAVYFYGYYKAECSVAGKLARLENPQGGLKPVGGNIEALIAKTEAQSAVELSSEQKEAVRNALLSGVSIITGGPGTGKTTIINTLISIVEGSGLKAAVAAPTGRAAKRVMETSGHFACTVHRLLEFFYDEETRYMAFGRNAEKPLTQDVVIIDEASMLDLLLAEALCNALKPGTRLILVGDADQLPSVGAGNVLADLIDSEFFFTSALTHIYRQSEQSGIVINAHRINSGDYPKFGEDFRLVKADKHEEILRKIVDISSEIPKERLQVLTPTKKGLIGSISLNEHLQKTFNPPSAEKDELKFGSTVFRVGDRVMQNKNDYQIEYKAAGNEKAAGKGVFNGEIGTVAAVDKEMKTVTVVYDDTRWVEYPYIQLDELELAYAITVHKSQGSEFPVVILPMSWFPPVLATRSLLYTAVTRGKEDVVIVGNPQYMNGMVDNNRSKSRNSGLKARIVGMCGLM
jgi:helicase, recD/traA family